MAVNPDQPSTSGSNEKPKPVKSETIPKSVKFLFGGTSGLCAYFFAHPTVLVKNRMVMSGEGTRVLANPSTLSTFGNIIRNEGPMSLYEGLSAGMLRQATYTTFRFGTYTYLFETLSHDNQTPSFPVKVCIGMVAGGVGALLATPTEVPLVRMTTDGRLPLAQRRGYKNIFDAFYRIVKEEGPLTLFRAASPTIVRAMAFNGTLLATYSETKELLLRTQYFNDNAGCHFVAGIISGIATAIVGRPIDLAKTRLQNMRIIDGKPEYKHTLDVFVKVIRKEGYRALWKGFTPTSLTQGTFSVSAFMFLEELNGLYYKYVLGTEKARGGL